MTILDDPSTTVTAFGPASGRAIAAARAAADARGSDVRVLDLRGLTPMFDYFVVATGTSSRQIHAMADDVKRTLLERHGDRPRGTEGYADARWVVLDYGDVVVHLFDAAAREYWDLEGLWSDGKVVAITP